MHVPFPPNVPSLMGDALRLTLPLGLLAGPEEASDTVAVQVVEVPKLTVPGVHDTEVKLEPGATVRRALPVSVDPSWRLSP